jgi:hypothetical protein
MVFATLVITYMLRGGDNIVGGTPRLSVRSVRVTTLTALLFSSGILRLISQKLLFVHYVQCRRLRSP